jgi:NADH-quinone oxidoreductase subunit C
MSAETVAAIKASFPRVTDRPSLDHPAFNAPADDVPEILRALRDGHSFDFLADVTAIDWAQGANPRFTVVYHLFSTVTHEYLRVAADCPPGAEPEVPSVTALWPGANWHEREVYDMFGIRFSGHPDLRRILMWDGYPHFPLRKEFPLAGIEAPLADADVVSETGVSAKPAPMAGGPFVASSGEMNLTEAEPRAKDESWTERREKPGAD